MAFRAEADTNPTWESWLCTIGADPGRAFTCNNIFGWNTFAVTSGGSLGFIENAAAVTPGWTVITLKAIPV